MLRSRYLRRGLTVLLGMGAAVGIEVVTPPPATAFPWGELIFRGIELFQLSTLSAEQRVEIGGEIHQEVINNYTVTSGSDGAASVDRIGQQLAAVSDCSDYPFRFYVVQDPSRLDRSTIAALGYEIAVDLPWSRRAEFAADEVGLAYLTRAGYSPYALPNFLSKLLQSPSPPAFLSDHPAPHDRIEVLEEKIAAAESS